MPLPPTVRVKLSSEAAGVVSITPVVVQDLPTRELIEHMLGITGKDETRIREILLRGTLVTGASRFRWPGWEPDLEALRAVLASFPDSDPSLPFAAERCVRVLLRGGRQPLDLPQEAAARKPRSASGSFWDLLMEIAVGGPVAYAGYSYRDRTDRYLRDFSAAETERVRAGSARIAYTTLQEQIRSAAFSRAELFATRPAHALQPH